MVKGQLVWTNEEILDAIRAWAEREGSPPTGLAWRHAGYGHPSVCLVRDRFGTMADAVRAAGFVAERKRGGYPTHWTKDRIAEAFLDHLFANGRWPTQAEWHGGCGAHRTGRGAPRPSATTVKRVFGTWLAAQAYAGRSAEDLQRRFGKRRRVSALRRAGRSAGRSFVERARKVTTWSCAGCGIPERDARTPGCRACSDRASKRRTRALAEATA